MVRLCFNFREIYCCEVNHNYHWLYFDAQSSCSSKVLQIFGFVSFLYRQKFQIFKRGNRFFRNLGPVFTMVSSFRVGGPFWWAHLPFRLLLALLFILYSPKWVSFFWETFFADQQKNHIFFVSEKLFITNIGWLHCISHLII